ncbi:hypothetical protein BC941DRAFT_518480 [Chlamydoabsidia padenii]|nr:hypothetical protein BC941DRAFT_518480 [Chlamydoabsidia padenii]
MDILLPTKNKEFYIELTESRFYFPGDLIKGAVVLNLDTPTKTNHIRVTLTGNVQADNTSKQILQTSWFLASSPLNDGKSHVLEAQTHRFHFEFIIPNDSESARLPSSFRLSSLLGVSYMITAVHDRPFVPERLSSQARKEIRLLEKIDVAQPEYCARGYVYEDVQVSGLSESAPKVRLALTLPCYAVVRGDILPLEIVIKHHQALARPEGIKVHLIRRVYSSKNRERKLIKLQLRHKLLERKSIKSYELDIDITEEEGSQFQQTIHTKLLIPTNTPPTVYEGGGILTVDYSVRVVVNLNDSNLTELYHENYIKLESNVVIGTFPKPNLSIDDDDDDDGNQGVSGEDLLGFDDDDDDHIGIQSIASSLSDNSAGTALADRTEQQLGIHSKPLPSLGAHARESSFSMKSDSITNCHSSRQQSISTSTTSNVTIIDPTIRHNSGNTNHNERTFSSFSQSTTKGYRQNSLNSSSSSNNLKETTVFQKYEPMKPNRKSSVSSISSLPEPHISPSPSMSSSPSLLPSSPPPIPLNSRPQPTASISNSTVSYFTTTLMPDISAYVPFESPIPPPPPSQQQQQHSAFVRPTASTSTTTYVSDAYLTVTANKISPSSFDLTYQSTQGTPLSMPAPHPSHQPTSTLLSSTSMIDGHKPVNVGGFTIPMTMSMPGPTHHTSFYSPSPSFSQQDHHHHSSSFAPPPTPPRPQQQHSQYPSSSAPPPTPPRPRPQQQQQQYSNNYYYMHHPSTGS